MTQADTRDSTPRITASKTNPPVDQARRRLLTIAAGGAVAAAIPAATLAAAPAVDPIFALIAAKRAADLAHDRACGALNEAEVRYGVDSDEADEVFALGGSACHAAYEAGWPLATTPPTTLAGVAAVLRFAPRRRSCGDRNRQEREASRAALSDLARGRRVDAVLANPVGFQRCGRARSAHGDTEGSYHPVANPADRRSHEERLSMVKRWREALARQLLTPASDVAHVAWKQATLAGRQIAHTDVKPERLERAIADDLAWLERYPVRQSKCRSAKADDTGRHRCERLDILDGA
jgi:hypothetical protein